jgi:hypothetical protein
MVLDHASRREVEALKDEPVAFERKCHLVSRVQAQGSAELLRDNELAFRGQNGNHDTAILPLLPGVLPSDVVLPSKIEAGAAVGPADIAAAISRFAVNVRGEKKSGSKAKSKPSKRHSRSKRPPLQHVHRLDLPERRRAMASVRKSSPRPSAFGSGRR